MEELAKLEEQRGNAEYVQAGSRTPMTRGSAGKMPEITGGDYCPGDCGDSGEYGGGGGVL